MNKESGNEFRHNLIQQEFRSVISAEEYKLPIESDAIVVLSAAPDKMLDGTLVEGSIENKARIELGIDLLKQIAAEKAGKKLEDLTDEDISNFAPPLVLNGETEQLPAMEILAKEQGLNPDKIELVDCGKRGVGNTRTQFQVMNEDERFKNAKHLSIISTWYHVPRVTRTAISNLEPKFDFDVFGVSASEYPISIYRIRGEVRRIETYSARGDIARNVQ